MWKRIEHGGEYWRNRKNKVGGKEKIEGRRGKTGLPAVSFGDLECKVSIKDKAE